MAKGKKTGGRDWKPGDCPNPNGRPPLAKEVLAAKRLSKERFEEIMNEFIHMSKEQVAERLRAPGTPAIELMVGAIIVKAAQAGDPVRSEFLLSRLLGRAPLKVEHTGADGGPIRTSGPESMTDEELDARIKELTSKP